MRFFQTKETNLLTIFIQNDAMHVCWLKPAYNTTKKSFRKNNDLLGNRKFCVQAYHAYTLSTHISDEKILYNVATIKQFIHSFIDKYSLTNAYCSIALDNSMIKQDIRIICDTNPTSEQLGMQDNNRFSNDYIYIGPHEKGYMFYSCSIARTVLLQYQLLFRTLPLHLINITTSINALLQLYQHAQGKQLVQSKLTKLLDIDAIYCLFNVDFFNNVLQSKIIDITLDCYKSPLLTALGLVITSGVYEYQTARI